ncbi:MAG: helical backbone metal receptor [Gemmatimonadota bacterium]|nr:helical backbone metal receptor [Gemmatimonadota bacterium]
MAAPTHILSSAAGSRRSGWMPALLNRLRAFTAFLSVLFLACQATERAPGETRELDDFGVPVPSGAQAFNRIVSLNPTTTEILFALGAGERLVGRSDWDQWPTAAWSVSAVGPGLRPNVEAVLSRDPDLVVLYASADNRGAAERMRAAGIVTISLKVDRVSDFRDAVRLLGGVTGLGNAASALVDSVDAVLRSVRAATAKAGRPTIFWHVWDAPIITIGQGSYLDELVEIAGAKNIYSDLRAPSPQVALEDVARRNPRFILAGPVGAQVLASDPRWQVVPAVAGGRILIVDTALVGRPSVNLGDAALSLARLLHPRLGL